MYKYEKKLEFPVNVTKKDLRMAKYIVSSIGGTAGELNAALRYFTHSFNMPDEKGKALLTDIAVEELSHLEIVATLFKQLIKDATIEELEQFGLAGYYVEHGKGVFPVNALGNDYTASYFQSSGNPVVDLAEDMAAEEKARAGYENLLNLTDDEAVIGPLLFLRQREIIHYNRFSELYYEYKDKYNM